MKLESNSHLSTYLIGIESRCRELGLNVEADRVRSAGRYTIGSPSEFLHQAQEALKVVLVKGQKVLNAVEREEITSVINQIEKAFANIGGA
ncbi:MAG: hypothetical protein ABI432_18055 [Flavobacteriales bacterium]